MEDVPAVRWTRVGVSDPVALENLTRFLERAGCRVRLVADVAVEVLVESAVRQDAAALELDVYLRTWEAASGGSATSFG